MRHVLVITGMGLEEIRTRVIDMEDSGTSFIDMTAVSDLLTSFRSIGLIRSDVPFINVSRNRNGLFTGWPAERIRRELGEQQKTHRLVSQTKPLNKHNTRVREGGARGHERVRLRRASRRTHNQYNHNVNG